MNMPWMPWRATWSQVLAGAVASREEPKLEQGCGAPVWRTHTGAGSSWRTGLCGKDPCWRSEELAECHEGLYAKIFSQAECVLPMIMIVGEPSACPCHKPQLDSSYLLSHSCWGGRWYRILVGTWQPKRVDPSQQNCTIGIFGLGVGLGVIGSKFFLLGISCPARGFIQKRNWNINWNLKFSCFNHLQSCGLILHYF